MLQDILEIEDLQFFKQKYEESQKPFICVN